MVKKIKVFIVDDSAVIRQVLTAVLSSSDDIDVVGSAQDPLYASRKMEKNWPDVIVLDVEMPRMDGITFLKQIMSERPTAVIICSTLTEKNAQCTMDAFAAGAVDVITKPKVGLQEFINAESKAFISAIKSAALCNIRVQKNLSLNLVSSRKREGDKTARIDAGSNSAGKSPTVAKGAGKGFIAKISATEKIVAIGSSTGGTVALDLLLGQLNSGCCGVVVAQHMPPKFTAEFARRLDASHSVNVSEARDGERILAGHVYIAPGDRHLQVKRSGAQYYTSLNDGPPVNRHKPSVDVLFKSIAMHAGMNAMGVILTGMGKDGAQGLQAILRAGGDTIAQDKKTSAVFGMPAAAIELKAANHVLPLQVIGERIQFFSETTRKVAGN